LRIDFEPHWIPRIIEFHVDHTHPQSQVAQDATDLAGGVVVELEPRDAGVQRVTPIQGSSSGFRA
jgi:hypothetical protein